jgi:uncharacterized PurR-regulated membrane protein YhhQ (DUF165 family)
MNFLKKESLLVFIYILAIVAANISATLFGPNVTIINSFVFIGLDITCRDFLHEKWNKNRLFLKMLTLIILGGIISFLINFNSLRIALASSLTFVIATSIDFFIYQLLKRKSKSARVNSSNLVSSIVDSIIFPTVAFGSFLPKIIIFQIIAKISGGYLWFKILQKNTK